MLNFLRNNLIGIIEDNVIGLTLGAVEGDAASKIAYPFGIHVDPLTSSEPLFWSIYYFFALQFNPVLIYNLFVIASFALALIVGFFFYKHFLNNSYVALLMSALFTFSPYFYYRSQSHLALIQVWLLVLFIFVYLKSTRYRHFLFAGLLLSALVLTSNYLAFFGILFVACFFVAHQVVLSVLNDDFWVKKTLISHALLISSFVLVVMTALTPYIAANYLPEVTQTPDTTRTYELQRPIEDFFVFTSRPWYYFLPSVDNPFFGSITNKIVTSLEQDWGNFLVLNYFKSEHSLSYLGLVNFAFALIGLYHIYTFYKKDVANRSIDKNSAYWQKGAVLISVFLTACMLFAFTLPPYIVIKGIYLYTPSYLIFELFPMFRVLARLGIVILLIQLIFTGFGYLWFIKYFNSRFKYGHIAVLVFFVFSLAEFFIPIRVTTVSLPPQVYSYMGGTLDESDVFVVYPRGYEVEAVFWMREHNTKFTNASRFTDNLKTCSALARAKSLGVTHLVYFYSEGASTDEMVVPFVAMDSLTAIANFENNAHPRRYSNFAIKRDNLKDNVAILYRLGNVNCD